MNLTGRHPCVCAIESMIQMHRKDVKVPIPVLIIY